jgi:signal transduction histidine kinase
VPEVLLVLELAIEIGFAVLAIRTILTWVHEPDRRHANLALALGSLAVLILIAPVLGGAGPGGQAVTDVGILLFLVSGFGLLMFRDSFVPFRPSVRRSIIGAIVVVGLLGVVVTLPANPEAPHSVLQSVVLVSIVGVWAFSILEPIATFWIAAADRPAVERARLRSISIGYAGLLVIVVVGTVAGSLTPGWTLVLDLAVLAIVPILYVAFFPPAWLRRIWRQPEEDQFRHALHDLLLYSPDRATLAKRALGWAERLVGGEAAFVLDSDGSILASRGVTAAQAAAISAKAQVSRAPGEERGHAPWREGTFLIVPLDLREGRGGIVIMTGRLSPMFGDDELSRLRQYAASITAGLDRVALNSRIAALERAKSDFLNIASHELRGPMTVIKGYLTMLDSGSLGDVPSKAKSVLPLLISKSDEVNWMIEQMIEASRLEEGRLSLKKHRTDIVELTDIAIDGTRMLLSNHHLKVDEPPQSIEADVDPDRFQIVVRNLLSNAAKYSAAGTDISVEVRRDGALAIVAVTDHGVGISSEDQTSLFTRFGRIESAAHVQGTGLGLWLSREIARMHDGDLTVKSSVGQGSTFVFMVPTAG